MTLIYALRAGQTARYTEELIATKAQSPAQIEAVKMAAAKDGFHSFRIVEFQDAQSGAELAGMFRRAAKPHCNVNFCNVPPPV
jgi:hypothetical protein